jgi:hypothetical protein
MDWAVKVLQAIAYAAIAAYNITKLIKENRKED